MTKPSAALVARQSHRHRLEPRRGYEKSARWL